MELLVVVVIGACLGILPRYLLPGRKRYGSALLPSIGATVSAIVWAALTWLDWSFDGGWIWVVSLVSGVVASIAVALLLPPRRERSDAVLFERLTKA